MIYELNRREISLPAHAGITTKALISKTPTDLIETDTTTPNKIIKASL